MKFPDNTARFSGLSRHLLWHSPTVARLSRQKSLGAFLRAMVSSRWGRNFLLTALKTYYAILHCTDRSFLERRVFIYIAGTSGQREYVRSRDARYDSRGFVAISHMAKFDERQIRVPLAPTRPLLSIFPGFWLRTLQRRSYPQSSLTILSNRETFEVNHVR